MQDGHLFLTGAKTMTKDEIISAVAFDCEQTKAVVKSVMESYFTTIADELAVGCAISLGHIGSFKIKEVPAHAARNPKTGEALHIPDGKRVKFIPSAALKQAVSSS